MINQAAILIGGLATRLQPLCEKIPKALVDINGKPFLQHHIECLRDHGVTRMVLCVGHLADQIVDFFGDGSQFGVSIQYSHEDKRLGSAGAVKNAEKLLDNAFFVTNGDTYLEMDYEGMAGLFREKGKSAIISVYQGDDIESNIYLNKEKIVLRFIYPVKKGPISGDLNATHSGVSILRREVLEMIPKNQEYSLEENVFPELAKKGELLGYPADRYYDIGTLERLELARRVMK
jgi:mannose-1-phosphate guanylyltransferase